MKTNTQPRKYHGGYFLNVARKMAGKTIGLSPTTRGDASLGCTTPALLPLLTLILTACFVQPTAPAQSEIEGGHQTTIIAQDLLGPVGLALLPDGSLLIAEEGIGDRDSSAGITLVRPDGSSGRLISGLFSTRDAGDLAGVPLVSVSPDGTTVYVANFGRDHLWTLPAAAFTDEEGNAQLPAEPFQPDDLGQAMPPLNNVRLTNPFDMTYDADGTPVVSDASQNGVATTNPDGTTRFFHRFERMPNPARAAETVEAVPTGITRVDDEYFITLFSGCPYPAGSGQLVAIDTERNQRTVLDGLNLPIDIAQGPDGTLWLLEFARFTPDASCFDGSGYQPNTGQLSIVEADGARRVLIEALNFPGSVLPALDGSLYVSEVLSGRVIRITFEDADLAAEESEQQIETQQAETQRNAGPQFVDVAPDVGLDFEHGSFREGVSTDHVAAMGAGLCWIDYDRDGWLDLYLVNSHATDEVDFWTQAGGLPTNGLFRNIGGEFEDVRAATRTDLALRGNGCVAADFNGDGWPDIFVTAYGPNALLWNNGDGTFSEGAMAAGLAAAADAALDVMVPDAVGSGWNSAASVGDLNGDGWLDLFVAGYIDLSRTIPKPTGHFPQDYYGIPDRIYINLGPSSGGDTIRFREVTDALRITRSERGLGSLLSDLDQDGDLDLYIANDGQPNRLYENEPMDDGVGFRFVDLTETADVGDSGSGMGVTHGDYDGDGELDLFVTNWDTELNALYRNLRGEAGALTFQYSTYRIGMAGLGNNLTGWGTHLVDVDHDTDLDIITVNGHVPIRDFAVDAQLVRYYQNRTRTVDGEFESAGAFFDWTRPAGLRAVGPLMARGSATADYDNDGDLDVAVNTIGGAAVLLQNQTVGAMPRGDANWLVIDPGMILPGLRVAITLPDGRRLVREVLVGSSYLASEDPRLHFGIGVAEFVPTVEVMWPDGGVDELFDVGANQILSLWNL